MSATPRAGDVWRLGRVEYEDGQLLMERMVVARQRGAARDSLFLLEHPHSITLGRRAAPEHILLDEADARSLGVGVFDTGRGGDVTYHGPGQVVGYPILDLKPDRCDAHRYVRDLEEVMIQALAAFGITAGRVAGLTGVWVGDEKIGAIGVRLSRWVTSHGFALNVRTDLRAFSWIVPCGISDRGVTSMERILGQAVATEEVETALIDAFARVFHIDLTPREDVHRSIQVVVVRPAAGGGWEALAMRRVPALGGFWQPVTGRIEAGESPREAAEREVWEELGVRGQAQDLAYVHRLMIDPEIAPRLPIPTVFEEHAFAVPIEEEVRLDPATHDDLAWLSLDAAAERMRWPGNRKAVRMVSDWLRAGSTPALPPRTLP